MCGRVESEKRGIERKSERKKENREVMAERMCVLRLREWVY